VQSQRRSAARLRVRSKAEMSHATLLPLRFCTSYLPLAGRIGRRGIASCSIPPLDGEGGALAWARGVGWCACPHPDAAKKRRRTSLQGGGMESVAAPRPDTRLHCRDANAHVTRARQIFSPGANPRGMRGWRAEKRKILRRRLRCRTRQAPLGAPHALIFVRYRASRYLSADRGRPWHERMLICSDLSDRQAPLSP